MDIIDESELRDLYYYYNIFSQLTVLWRFEGIVNQITPIIYPGLYLDLCESKVSRHIHINIIIIRGSTTQNI